MSSDIIISTTNPELALRQLNELHKLYQAKGVDQASIMFPRKVSHKELYYRIVQWSGLGPSVRMDEAAGISWQTGTTPFKKDFFPWIYHTGVKYSVQAKEKDFHNIYKRFGPEMDRSQRIARNVYAADMLLNNTVTATGEYQGIDGVALSSTAHPTKSGTNWSNRATGAALAQDSFDATIDQLWLQLEYTDTPYMPEGPWNILYPRQLRSTVRKLLETDRIVGAMDNDKNVNRDLIRDPGPMMYATNTTRFGFVPVNNSPFFEVEAMAPMSREDFDINVPCYKLLNMSERVFGWASAYNTAFNEGA